MDESGPPNQDPVLGVARQLRAITWVALLVMIPVVFYFTTEGTWDLARQRAEGGYSGGFFMAQAQAIVHGRLNVPRGAIHSECWDREGRCYGYFGITPSLLRVPFLGILRWFPSSLTPLFLGFAVLLAYWAALRLLRRSLSDGAAREQSRALVLGYAAIGAIALGPGGTMLFLTRPAVYEEAAAWGVAFFLLALDRVWVWHRSRARSPLAMAVLFGIAAASARPTTATACGVLGLVVLALGRFRHQVPSVTRSRALVGAVCLSLLPGLTAAGVFWLKFREPVPDFRLNEQVRNAPFWAEILQKNGNRTTGLVFTPTELVAYFRPDAVIWGREWPYFDFRFPQQPIVWVPPLPPGGAYVERVASLTSTMPLPWTVNAMVAVWLGLAARRLTSGRAPSRSASRAPALLAEDWVFAAGSVAAAAAMAIPTITTVGITNRYLNDFFAMSVVGVALGPRILIPALARRPVVGALATVVALLLTGWSVAVVLSLTAHLLFD